MYGVDGPARAEVNHPMAVKNIHIQVDEATYAELADGKGDRTWREAMLDEFGIEP